MQEKIIKAFKNIKYNDTRDLEQNIWNIISTKNKRNNKIKFYILAFVGVISFIGIIPSFQILLGDLAQSGFYEYSSLMFANNIYLASYWKELTFSLAESLPAISIILNLSLVFVFFLSLKHLVRQIINNQLLPQINIA